jgi:hypothetical protein
MIIIDCEDLPTFISDNIPLGDDKEDEALPEVREDYTEELVVDE